MTLAKTRAIIGGHVRAYRGREDEAPSDNLDPVVSQGFAPLPTPIRIGINLIPVRWLSALSPATRLRRWPNPAWSHHEQ
jgi:hypothetical protein